MGFAIGLWFDQEAEEAAEYYTGLPFIRHGAAKRTCAAGSVEVQYVTVGCSSARTLHVCTTSYLWRYPMLWLQPVLEGLGRCSALMKPSSRHWQAVAELRTGVFKDSSMGPISRYPSEDPGDQLAGSVLTAAFTLNGQRFNALNGGPRFKFNEAVSMVVECEGQDEIDYYWDALSAVSEAEACGWCKDRFGLSWQIVPKGLGEIVGEGGASAKRAMGAMMTMKKIDVAAIQRAARGES